MNHDLSVETHINCGTISNKAIVDEVSDYPIISDCKISKWSHLFNSTRFCRGLCSKSNKDENILFNIIILNIEELINSIERDYDANLNNKQV